MNIKLSMKRGVRGTFLFTLALALTIFVAACSKNANTGNSSNSINSSNSSANSSSSTKPVGSSPTDALKAYYDAAKSKDMETAKRYLSHATVQMMEDIAKSQGKTLDQMKQAKLLDPWKKYSGEFISEDAFLETLYNSLSGQKNGKFIKHN